MRPARILGGVPESIERSTTHDSAMEEDDDAKLSHQSVELSTDAPDHSSNFILGRSHDTSPPSDFGLRHDIRSGGANVNMPDAYARIQAYKPPAYVSPYGQSATSKIAATANKSVDLSTKVDKPRRLLLREDPPWLCCFAQKRIPEWRRHAEVSAARLFPLGRWRS